MLKRNTSNNSGFTLIEIIVSIAILILLMLTSFFYLRSNNTSVQVRLAASVLSDVLRTAQNNAQTGVLVNCTSDEFPDCQKVPSAFGVKIFTSGSDVPTAILYADVNQGTTPANFKYDAGAGGITEEAYPDIAKGTVVVDKMSLGGDSDVVMKSIVGGDNPGVVDIAFATPTATMYIDGDIVSGQVVITLEKGIVIKDVVIDRVTGRIEPKF